MNPVQYIIADNTLKMPAGKLAAQVAHASVEGLRLHAKEPWGNPWDASIVNRWYRGGHYAKVVLESPDLPMVERYLRYRGFKAALIIDEGRTVFDGGLTATALGCEVVDKDEPHVRETFGQFKLYGTADRLNEEKRAALITNYSRPMDDIMAIGYGPTASAALDGVRKLATDNSPIGSSFAPVENPKRPKRSWRFWE